jgi:hypothetical protein
MNQQQQKQDASRLFDHLIAVHKLKNDAELARKLDVAAPVISKMRKGTIQLGATLTLNIHETFLLPVVQIRELTRAAA